jgi:hypothetical protein
MSMENEMLTKINFDGTDSIPKKKCLVVYALSVFGNHPFFARDIEEANNLIVVNYNMGCKSYVMDYEVPNNFEGWYYPKPLKSLEFSMN